VNETSPKGDKRFKSIAYCRIAGTTAGSSAYQVMIKADAPMTEEQATLLKQLATDAFEPEAFRPHLTRSEAAQRIAVLRAKLKLQDGPPHTF
jgi:hypothetical protein